MKIQTAAGEIDSSELGRTLVHEHILVGMSGWQSDTAAAPVDQGVIVTKAKARIAQLREAGFGTIVDPCPNDTARDVALLARIADETGFNIVFASGLYFDAAGSHYWRTRMLADPDAGTRLEEMLVSEATVGVPGAGRRSGVFKVASGEGAITPYEEFVLRAVARACVQTGNPIITHTASQLGVEQVAIMTAEGVPADRIMVGHSCGSTDPLYHAAILDTGAYLGFDQFGWAHHVNDEERAESVVKVKERGGLDRLLVSHDAVWHWMGDQFTPDAMKYMMQHLESGYGRVPALLASRGLTDDELDLIFRRNTRRFLEAGRA